MRGKTKMKVFNPSHCQLKFKWKPNHNFNILLCHLVRHGTKCTFVNTKCFPLPGQWLRSRVPGALRRPPATAGCRLSRLRMPGSGTPPCRPEAASAWRCRSWAAPSRIDTAEQLHPAGGKKRMNARGSLATMKGNRVSADETFVDMKILYIWMQEKTQKRKEQLIQAFNIKFIWKWQIQSPTIYNTWLLALFKRAIQMFSSEFLNVCRLWVTCRLLMDRVLWNTVQATACSHPGVVMDPTYR